MILTPEQMMQWIDETWTEAQKVAWAKASADQVVRAYENGYKAGYKAGAAAVREVCAKVCEEIAEDYDGSSAGAGADNCATAIRARGRT
jgi:flagellar biosynthesis/type III secretory pathway protein FliH